MLLLALLSDDELGRLAREASGEFAKISVETLWSSLPEIVAGSPEDAVPRPDRSTGHGAGARAGTPGEGGKPSRTPALDQYTINLTQRGAGTGRSTRSSAARPRSARWSTS